MVDEPKVVPIWMAVVEDAVAKFKDATPEEQELICLDLGKEYNSPQAAEKARELFKAELGRKAEQQRLMAEVVDRVKARSKIKIVREEDEELEPRVVWKSKIAPGLVGEVADFTVGSAMYPSVGFALGGSIVLIGTLIGRRIAGPSGPLGTGTHLYVALAGPTGSGKEHIRTVTKLLLTSVSAAALIGPGRFKSGAAIITHLLKKPVSLCVMDEFGSMLHRFALPNAQFYHQDETEIMRELWGISWGRYDSPEGANSDSEAVLSPALSIIGMSTPKELYKACRSRDITNGFLNRWLFVEEKTQPGYRRVSEDALVVPKELKQMLGRLYQPSAVLLGQPVDGSELRPLFRMSWGPGAEEIWDEVRRGVERESDDRKRELFWRSPEKTVRIATNVAAGCLSKTVNRDHMEWAHGFVARSDETLLTGVREHMEEEKLEFSELCREIIRRVRREGGSMLRRDVLRSFQNNLTRGLEVKGAIDYLIESEQLIERRIETGGRPSWRLELPKEEPKKEVVVRFKRRM